jgi:hypothetical protein
MGVESFLNSLSSEINQVLFCIQVTQLLEQTYLVQNL